MVRSFRQDESCRSYNPSVSLAREDVNLFLLSPFRKFRAVSASNHNLRDAIMSSSQAPAYHFVSPVKQVNVALWTLFGGATTFLGFRIWCKVTRRYGLWYDDYILFFSWVRTLRARLATWEIGISAACLLIPMLIVLFRLARVAGDRCDYYLRDDDRIRQQDMGRSHVDLDYDIFLWHNNRADMEQDGIRCDVA